MRKILSRPLLLILILASLVRLIGLSKVPPSLNWDEVSMGYSAYSILQTGHDEWGKVMPLLFRSYGEWKSPLYIYLLVPFLKFFGNTAFAVRLPSVLAGIISVYLAYLIASILYNKKVALWTALFMALNPWALMLSRPGFEANLSLTLSLAGLYFFLRFLNHPKLKFSLLSALFFGLAPHAYNSAKLFVPLLILYLVWVNRAKLLKFKKLLYLPILTLFIFAYPILINLLTGHSQARLTQVGLTTDLTALTQFYSLRHNPVMPATLGKLLFNKVTFTLYQLTDNLASYFSPQFLLTSGGNHHQHSLPFQGVLYLTELVLALIGLVYLWQTPASKRNSTHFLPLVILITGVLPASLTRDQGHVLRSILVLPAWQMLAGLGFVQLRSKFWRTTLTSLFILQSLSFLFLYFSWYPYQFARDWQYGHQQVAQYLDQHQDEYQQIVMTKWYGEPQLFLAFYNRWDPVWYQQQNKTNLRYVDENKLWLDQLETYSIGKYKFKYLDWNKDKQANTLYIGKFDDFDNDAKVLKTITYPNGDIAFIIATF